MTSTSAFIAKCSAPEAAARRLPPLFVFSDDWGRHPSSCQHLVRRLLDRHEVYWINTIGTRIPRLDLATLRRGFGKARQWLAGSGKRDPLPANLHMRNPWMWPSFGSRFGRWLNRRLLGRHLAKLARSLPEPPVVLTTIPLVADLVGRLPARRWVYYCVDDFSKWPGLDQATMQQMEERLVGRVDAVVAVSENLCERLAQMGRDAPLLTHGVDLDFWTSDAAASFPGLDKLERPLVVFWGVIDRRMDVAFVKALAESMTEGTVLLIGPEADPDPALYGPARVVRWSPVPFERLPSVARAAGVLVMPYADLPVTRAMQPLKLKEYLATGKPAVVRNLPANRDWADCLDLVETPAAFVEAVHRRLATGLPAGQKEARARLASEGWEAKARLLEKALLGEVSSLSLSDRERTRTAQPRQRRSANVPVVLDTRVVRGSGGGPDKTILNQPRFLAPAGYRNPVGILHPPGDPGFEVLRRKAEARGASLVSIPDRGPLDWKVIPQLLHYCRRERVRIWHGHDYKSNALGLLLSRFWPMRLVTTVHGWVHHTERTPFYYWIDRLCLQYYEKVLCVSDDLHRRCLECGVPPERCSVIENGIDLEEYQRRHSIEEAKRRLGLDPERLLIGAVGRLSAEKGFDLLIRAVDRLLPDGVNAELIVIGEGDQRAPLQELIDHLDRRERVRLVGFRAELAEWYEAMDVYALSSLREGLPNVLLEAMALEVPVVATRIAGVPGLIHDGANGLLIEPGSVEELAGGLARLLKDVELRERYRKAGRHTVETSYSFAARMDKIRAIYDGLLGRNEVAVTGANA